MHVRTILAGLAAVAMTVVGGTAPAHATTLADSHMQFTFACFGCGNSTHSGWYWCYGYCQINGQTCIGECHWQESGTDTEGTGTDCLVSGTMTGTISGVNESFALSRLGSMYVMSTSSGASGFGVVAITSPVGLPCGAHNVVMTAVGVLAGA